MILGCSNTYQQLVTAPQVEEIPWILSKNGEARVGTNSPWNINVKRSGKAKAWDHGYYLFAHRSQFISLRTRLLDHCFISRCRQILHTVGTRRIRKT
ncbi:hypothetical protein DID88_006795 [Monilinia fructigena]|uniref:Uncharacterized protein n=1 Tax=Monilinia fructigena TaxID=38457 RepID=A0A395IGY4_9HELO|nr:hypothetical protein DID88_006795 [Monilinia fructigena]